MYPSTASQVVRLHDQYHICIFRHAKRATDIRPHTVGSLNFTSRGSTYTGDHLACLPHRSQHESRIRYRAYRHPPH
jgi:hypothetical protein